MPERKIIYILILVILAVLLVWVGYFLGVKKETSQKEAEKPEAVFSDKMQAGEVGEILVKEEESEIVAPFVSSTMPPAIFSTAGVITELKSDGIVVRGEGTNFADGVPRTLTVIFTADTITFNKNQSFRWHGLAGLEQLQPDMEVLIEGAGNIRGKTEFEAKTINIL